MGAWERLISVGCALLGLFSLAALLAWVFGLGTFAVWFWWFSFPSTVLLAAVAVALRLKGPFPRLQVALAAGAFGGLIGTFGYDLFRIPFSALGLRLMAPIDSYGVLLMGADSSNPWTGFAGWGYHFSNGIGFGVAYGIVALGKRWWWGVGWGLVLETATILTPFASTYQIKGQWGLIAIAYLAHIAYGFPLGKIVERAGTALPREAIALPFSWCMGALAVALFLWHRPFVVPEPVRAGQRVAPGASAVILRGRFAPLWLRIPTGGCATLRNDDSQAHKLTGADGDPMLVPGVASKLCIEEEGIHRVRVANEPYSGGFVIVDPEISP